MFPESLRMFFFRLSVSPGRQDRFDPGRQTRRSRRRRRRYIPRHHEYPPGAVGFQKRRRLRFEKIIRQCERPGRQIL